MDLLGMPLSDIAGETRDRGGGRGLRGGRGGQGDRDARYRRDQGGRGRGYGGGGAFFNSEPRGREGQGGGPSRGRGGAGNQAKAVPYSPYATTQSSRGGGRGGPRQTWDQGNRGAASLNPDENPRVFLDKLPMDWADTEVRTLLEKQGALKDLRMYSDRSGRYTGKALATFISASGAQAAVQALNGATFEGSTLVVELTKPKDRPAPTDAKTEKNNRPPRQGQITQSDLDNQLASYFSGGGST